jgi:uncharacterized protein YceH (UPF0502 family)
MSDVGPRPSETQSPRWRPLPAIDRRIVGVLVEKAKTTPEAYPLSANALRSGANQKNNRYPLMELEIEDIEESLERLRATGAVTEVQGGGRVARFRHHLYEWLGVDKVELAVMTELLLRGAQTEGELRGRAARMEPIADVAALRPVLASLVAKGLVISLTPEGRGHMVTHALYEPRELEKLRAEHAGGGTHVHSDAPGVERDDAPSTPEPASRPSFERTPTERPPAVSPAPTANWVTHDELDRVREELSAVRNELADLRADYERLKEQLNPLIS